jgi:polyphosphate kinase
LTIDEAMPSHIKELLKRNLEIDEEDIFPVEGALGLSDLMSIYSIDRPDLKFAPFAAATPPDLRDLPHRSELFRLIRHQDILLHHPYHSFVPIIDFLKAAARDPNVLAIKQTLYRVGQDSPIVQALMEARENGKEVAVLVELKARFDEESNIGWARALEKVGVHVVYGLMGLKTHSKITLVIRKEKDGLRRYLHLGTGNYNATTAQLYTDLGLLTCNEAFGRDASNLFNFLTGYSGQNTYETLLVAPTTLRQQLETLIRREIEQHKKHGQGRLILKMNALVDPEMIDLLYEASQAGVKIDLLVRGICCLRPQVPHLSENIHVLSVVGRYLEHSRIFYFHNGGDEEIYLGSADLMQRSLNWRVETVFPITDKALLVYLRDKVLARCLKDNVQARVLQADGSYKRLTPTADEPAFDSQLEFMRHAAEPHRPAPLPAAD